MGLPVVILVREPDLIPSQQGWIQQKRIVGCEEDLRAVGIRLRIEKKPEQLDHHRRVHACLQLVDAHRVPVFQNLQPRACDGKQAVGSC